MEQLQGALIILAMFLLRLGIPLAVMVAISYWLRRVDERWAAEARAYQQASLWEEQLAATPTKSLQSSNLPCWVIRGCSPEAQAHCAAAQQPCLPCWLARLRRDHYLPASCVQCQLFALPQPAAMAGD